jgi:predicted ATPase
MFHQTRTTALEDPQNSMLPDIATALVPITTTAWKTAQRLFKRLAKNQALI